MATKRRAEHDVTNELGDLSATRQLKRHAVDNRKKESPPSGMLAQNGTSKEESPEKCPWPRQASAVAKHQQDVGIGKRSRNDATVRREPSDSTAEDNERQATSRLATQNNGAIAASCRESNVGKSNGFGGGLNDHEAKSIADTMWPGSSSCVGSDSDFDSRYETDSAAGDREEGELPPCESDAADLRAQRSGQNLSVEGGHKESPTVKDGHVMEAIESVCGSQARVTHAKCWEYKAKGRAWVSGVSLGMAEARVAQADAKLAEADEARFISKTVLPGIPDALKKQEEIRKKAKRVIARARAVQEEARFEESERLKTICLAWRQRVVDDWHLKRRLHVQPSGRVSPFIYGPSPHDLREVHEEALQCAGRVRHQALEAAERLVAAEAKAEVEAGAGAKSVRCSKAEIWDGQTWRRYGDDDDSDQESTSSTTRKRTFSWASAGDEDCKGKAESKHPDQAPEDGGKRARTSTGASRVQRVEDWRDESLYRLYGDAVADVFVASARASRAECAIANAESEIIALRERQASAPAERDEAKMRLARARHEMVQALGVRHFHREQYAKDQEELKKATEERDHAVEDRLAAKGAARRSVSQENPGYAYMAWWYDAQARRVST